MDTKKQQCKNVLILMDNNGKADIFCLEDELRFIVSIGKKEIIEKGKHIENFSDLDGFVIFLKECIDMYEKWIENVIETVQDVKMSLLGEIGDESFIRKNEDAFEDVLSFLKKKKTRATMIKALVKKGEALDLGVLELMKEISGKKQN